VQSNKGASNDHSSIAKKPTSGLKPGYNNSCNTGTGSRHEGGGSTLSSGLSDRSGLGKFSHSGHSSSGQVKRSPSFSTSAPATHGQPTKKHKMASLRDVSLAEAAKYGSLNDYAFFDKVSYEGNYFRIVDRIVFCPNCIIANILEGMHYSIGGVSWKDRILPFMC
jgi:hypothetical protein